MRYRPHRDMYACFRMLAECPASNRDRLERIHRLFQVPYSYSGVRQSPMLWISLRHLQAFGDRPLVWLPFAP